MVIGDNMKEMKRNTMVGMKHSLARFVIRKINHLTIFKYITDEMNEFMNWEINLADEIENLKIRF